ncbi:uroporphyrinogen-III C-methyltransferase [Cumulibacter manganitolerans]|uniref:uroporphyrinogen-III C-methyltransferase n=1 Tax=Cumulibacter manganitolerans TaxID=1884992 RepID=UPI001297F2A6|nr:uroporphyrinogen-III C-methyltransferase [Cumulibacter manganitolerans]
MRSPGSVVLVGGGPGDPGLLTVRGRDELLTADVVVADRLGPRDLLHEIGVRAEIVDVGKRPYHHPVPQARINRLLIDRARAGQRVVRLKGGDPFVFGRGGEEYAACLAAGVPVEVVPGVSSAIAAPAAAAIPVTHRGVSTGVLVFSGHDALPIATMVDWPHTVVVLMGMARLRELCAALQAAGMPPERPAAVIERAWTDRQRTVRADVGALADAVERAGVANPATIVIGDVVHAVAHEALPGAGLLEHA